MTMRMRELDWSQTSLGATNTWSQSLRSTLSICLNSRFPIALYWGTDFTLLYNDAWRPIVGDKHPWALGRPGQEVWSEIWDDIGPELISVLTTGEGTFHKDELLAMQRFGYTEECFFEYTFNPVQGQGGKVDGAINIVTETTYRILSDRRARLLREVASRTGTAQTTDDACAAIMAALQSDPADIPAAFLYLTDPDGKQARLYRDTEVANGSLCPDVVDLAELDDDPWRIALAAHTAQPQVIDQLPQLGKFPGNPWSETPQEAIVLPIAAPGQGKVSGVLLTIASPRRRLDEPYSNFFNQLAGQIAMAIANARAYEEERKRAEALTEIDRAKTVFFSNVSHEFRTPLTLMLSPLEDAIVNLSPIIPTQEREQLQLVQRNGIRLLKLVNTLLDFSRIEAGRVQAAYEPTDLAAFTAELASVFRSAIKRGNLRFIVDCSPLPELVYIDREMWDKIVLNLLSNALKFTFEGEISVGLQWQNDHIKLSVRDTGIGIPPAELPHLFERFHRVQGAKGRSIEGSGIGLSLVQELVKLHGGTVNVASVEGKGTCFTVSIPTGTAHLPQARIGATRTLASTALDANPYLEEALRWLPDPNPDRTFKEQEQNALAIHRPNAAAARLLIADDNTDMRDYVQRLLTQHYEVEAVADGVAALSAIRQRVPDLVLTDVMMPNLDGFGLLQALRSDAQTRNVPIILLSARAGEESRIEGLAAGADDYLVKPFSARELLARIEATLKLSQLRREALQQEQALRQSEEHFRAFVNASSDIVYKMSADWSVMHNLVGKQFIPSTVNPRRNWLDDYIPLDEQSRVWAAIQSAIRSKRNFELEHRVFRADGTIGWTFSRAIPLLDERGEIVEWFGAASDVTDRKEAELQREQLFAREQAAREEAQAAHRIKDEFLAVLSHELRSPLNPILGWATLLKSRTLNAEKTAQALTTIERNAKLQSKLIEDLLDVSRILQGKLSLNVSPVDLRHTIGCAIETVRLAAEAKSITIKTHLDEVGAVSGVATRLQQVAWNLLSNAVKFTPAGGHVAVRLEQIGKQVQLTVSDTGKGIDPSFLPHVFEYFRQEDGATTRKFGGLGLGLAIVRQIVELHGGTVAATSGGEGKGATFTVQLPLMPTPLRVSQTADHAERFLDLSGVRALVVDDEPDSRDFIAFVLEQAGAQVKTAASAGEAFAVLTRSQLDILLSDIGIPDMDGYMLLRQVRALAVEQGGQVPAIALTAYAAFDQQQALQAGFQKHLSKPVEPDQLVQEIVKLLQPN